MPRPRLREQIRHQLGLDRPLPVQYLAYVGRLASGDFGHSYARKSDVGDLIASRLPATLLLMLGAILAELLIGIPAGIYAASRRGRSADKVAMTLSFVTRLDAAIRRRAHPALCLRLSAGLVSAQRLRLPQPSHPAGRDARHGRRRLVFPHDAILDDRGAAPGLYPHRPRQGNDRRRASCSSMACATRSLPIIAMIGLDIGIFMSGVVVVENVFGWPGIGQLMWQAIQSLDIPIIMGVTTVAAVFIVLGNLAGRSDRPAD